MLGPLVRAYTSTAYTWEKAIYVDIGVQARLSSKEAMTRTGLASWLQDAITESKDM